MSMNNLIYLSYGSGVHEQEIAFSILSAYRWLGTGRPNWRIVVYTDRPASFSTLEVATVSLDSQTLEEWSGPSGFPHRRKLMVLRDALHRYEGPTALLDGDTYFRRSPRRLFERIGPGRTAMHVREGVVSRLPGAKHAELAAVLRIDGEWTDLAGGPLPITATDAMWNSGVVGVDPANRHLIDESIHLTDQLCGRLQMHTLEQFALGIVLGRSTRLREAVDVVFHYWDRSFRDPFHHQLPQLVARDLALPLAERARRCYASRPRPTLRSRVRTRFTRWLRTIGMLPPLEHRSE
jgi:hypothetical protein